MTSTRAFNKFVRLLKEGGLEEEVDIKTIRIKLYEFANKNFVPGKEYAAFITGVEMTLDKIKDEEVVNDE